MFPRASSSTEYIEVAHAFFDGDEPKVVNGLLDRMAKRLRPKEFDTKEAGCTLILTGWPPWSWSAVGFSATRRPRPWPPYSGAVAEQYVEGIEGIEVLGPRDGTWLLRAPDHDTLLDALAAAPRPYGRMRLDVDPLRV